MGKSGGRPKAEEIWDHVIVLPGKQVKCKYCGFEFAESANRIKSHIHQIKLKGIRICPDSPFMMREDQKEKEDLPNSPGSLIVDKTRDYNKPHETMLDCYMSPKTMWDGIKATQQVQTNTDPKHQERIKVGPFYVFNIEDERDLQLIQYVFERSSLDSYACNYMFSSSRSNLGQSELATLKPETLLVSSVIDTFADILTDTERRKKSQTLNWYLPVMFSTAALKSDDVSFLNKMRNNYMSDSLDCEKIFIPVHVGESSSGHYYLYIIHKKNQVVEIWDSLPKFMGKTERDQTTQKLLLAMDKLFGVDKFVNFTKEMASDILLQPNGYDCGIFVIKYMQQSDNYVGIKNSFQFDSHKERLDLALKLLKSDLNKEKDKLYEAARGAYMKSYASDDGGRSNNVDFMTGIEALQQTNTEVMHQEKIKVGPFYVSNNTVNESDLQLIQYVFERSSDRCKTFSSSRFFLRQSEFTTLRPQKHLDLLVIDTFADILTDIERRKESTPFNWYLPVAFLRGAENDYYSLLNFAEKKKIRENNFAEKQKIRENYMFGDLKDCEKIFIPVHVENNSCGHYYLYIIHMKNREVEIWDSLCHSFLDETERQEKTQELLLAMERLFGKVIMFTQFDLRLATNILLHPKGYDCGIFVINYMQQSDNYVRQNPKFQFDSDKERLDLALKLLKNDMNGEKERLCDKVARCYAKAQSQETSDDAGRGAYMEFDDSDKRHKKRKIISLKTECVKGYKLLTTDLVGDEFQIHTQEILGWIMKNEVSSIGIWGMGGVGKTALAIHVNNKLLQEASDDIDHIIWVTMSQCSNSVYELQKAIARSINVDVSDECDVRRISGKLLQAFEHINRCVLILDDVWDPIFLEDVGFLVSNNGNKLILTTRSWEVCQNMNCVKNIIYVEPLCFEDGRCLFERILGIHPIQWVRVKPIALNVVEQCEGLPLAIVSIARSMRGKEDITEWNHLLECLQSLDSGEYDVIKKVLLVLKTSYERLSSKLQDFFLCYALSAVEYRSECDDELAKKKESDDQNLIKRFFHMRWTDETKSLEMQYNEGYAMLKTLKNNRLLIKDGWYGREIHTFVRAMATNIAKKTDEIMAKTGNNLMKLPNNEEWKETLQKAFLTKSNIQKIPDGTSPKCTKLSTLLLDKNECLMSIPDDFFSNMPALQILDLSKTGIKHLPEFVSNLECLIALLLSQCKNLSYVPSLEKLKKLKELDLSGTAINAAPSGLELLANLRCLNLEGTNKLKMSTSTVSRMTNLESLLMMNVMPKSMEVSAEDLQGLKKLEVVSVKFCDIVDFNAYVWRILVGDWKLKKYCLSLSTLFFYPNFFLSSPKSVRRVVLRGIDLGNEVVLLPEDINELCISACDRWSSTAYLCHALSVTKNYTIEFSINDISRIERLMISESNKLEYLCCISTACTFCSGVQLVGTLSLDKLKDLKQIVAPFPPPLDISPLIYLKDLHISVCSSMKIVMTAELIAQLQNLATIYVKDCESMEEVVGGNDCSGNTSNPTIITLPKLTSVTLEKLPELNFLFRGTMLCPSLKHFGATHCVKLSAPDIEIIEGHKLQAVKNISTGHYYWDYDPNQAFPIYNLDDYDADFWQYQQNDVY